MAIFTYAFRANASSRELFKKEWGRVRRGPGQGRRWSIPTWGVDGRYSSKFLDALTYAYEKRHRWDSLAGNENHIFELFQQKLLDADDRKFEDFKKCLAKQWAGMSPYLSALQECFARYGVNYKVAAVDVLRFERDAHKTLASQNQRLVDEINKINDAFGITWPNVTDLTEQKAKAL
ncbi:MAG: hypothetical protein ACOY4O_16680 [Pseudomonadota bacterium]